MLITDFELNNIADILSVTELTDKSKVYRVEKENINKILSKFYSTGYTHLSTIIGYQSKGTYVLDYPISTSDPNFPNLNTVFVRTVIPSGNTLSMNTVTNIFPGSDVYEAIFG